MNFTKHSLRVYYILILPILCLLSNSLPEVFFGEDREFQILEIIQSLVLLSCLIIHFEYRKIFIKVSNLLTFILRQLLILILLYEELSFLTYNFNNAFNSQNEFNIHNSGFFGFQFFRSYKFLVISSVIFFASANNIKVFSL